MLPQKISSESIACKTKGFSVAASPLNAVKLELIVIFIIAGLFWLLLDGLNLDGVLQIILLGIYSMSAMLWVIFRTKKILRKISEVQESGNND